MVGVLVRGRAGVGGDRVDSPAGTHGQRVTHDDPAARSVPRGHEHVRPGLVVPVGRNREPVRTQPEAAGLPVEQAPEHARRVEARNAQPVDRPVGRDQRSGVAVRQEGVIRDRRERRRPCRALRPVVRRQYGVAASPSRRVAVSIPMSRRYARRHGAPMVSPGVPHACAPHHAASPRLDRGAGTNPLRLYAPLQSRARSETLAPTPLDSRAGVLPPPGSLRVRAPSPRQSGAADVPLERLLRTAGPDRRAALPHRTQPHRSEPALAHGRGDDQRGRLRPRLVHRRQRRDAGPLPERHAGVERPEPARSRLARRVAPVPRPHPSDDRDPGPADQLPSVPARALAVRAQRRHQRLPGHAPRPALRRRLRRCSTASTARPTPRPCSTSR